jgi:hypothetical protein
MFEEMNAQDAADARMNSWLKRGQKSRYTAEALAKAEEAAAEALAAAAAAALVAAAEARRIQAFYEQEGGTIPSKKVRHWEDRKRAATDEATSHGLK